MSKKYLCPKCLHVLKIKMNPQLGGGYETYQISCEKCQLKGGIELTVNFALACFYRDHGEQLIRLDEIERIGGPPAHIIWRRISRYPDAKKKGHMWFLPRVTAEAIIAEEKLRKSFVNLAWIRQAGGPPRSTMRLRIKNGCYPDALMLELGWGLPLPTAKKAIEDWKQRKEMIPLGEVAIQCGLKRRSLNPLATHGLLRGKRLNRRWFVDESELKRLQQHYSAFRAIKAE